MTATTRNWGWGIATGFCVLIVGTIIMPGGLSKERSEANMCLWKAKEIALSVQVYSSDYEDRLPLAASWQETLVANYIPREWTNCPTAPGRQFGYAMNRPLSGVKLTAINDPATQPMFFESAACIPNANGTVDLMPNPGRHNGRNTVVLANGHAKRWAPADRK